MKIDKLLIFGVGIVAGILLAPKKGSDTIDDIKDGFLDKTEYIKGRISDIKTEIEDDFDGLEESFYEKTDKIKNEFVELKDEIVANVEEAIDEVE
ncbi:gas vesicle protein [Bacilli bacterium PM5-3]|nr:gas vesicle protein [Bacilli bacterium PM5-3]MDH6603587.1 gas vesicle protein [Bacilli bacterium PM5-9]